MKKLLAMLLAGLMLVSVMSVAAFGLELPNISEYESDDGVTFYALLISTGTSKSGKGYVDVCGLSVNDINHRGLYTASFGENVEILDADGEVTLSWDKTDDESYTVYYKRSSSDEWKVAGTTTKHKVNITGLKNGVSYDFKIEATGLESETVTVTAE